MAVNILVTGGAGYVGSHACKALRKAGYIPVTYDNLIHGHEWAVQWGPLERGDVLDTDRLAAVFEQYKPQAVMHFAAHYAVGESVVQPVKYYQNNFVGTLGLLEVMRQHGCERLVFSSTAAVYGVPESLPIYETAQQKPTNPYGASKAFVEHMLEDSSKAYGLRSISLRYFNAAGADPDGDIGEVHDPETHLIPRLLQVASGQEEIFTVYGNDYDTPDGTCIRDYVHVTDLAQAHVACVTALLKGAETTAYNLGTGLGISVLEMIRIVEKVTGRSIPLAYAGRRQGDTGQFVAAIDAVRQALGWKSELSSPEKIVETAWNWHQTHSSR